MITFICNLIWSFINSVLIVNEQFADPESGRKGRECIPLHGSSPQRLEDSGIQQASHGKREMGIWASVWKLSSQGKVTCILHLTPGVLCVKLHHRTIILQVLVQHLSIWWRMAKLWPSKWDCAKVTQTPGMGNTHTWAYLGTHLNTDPPSDWSGTWTPRSGLPDSILFYPVLVGDPEQATSPLCHQSLCL